MDSRGPNGESTSAASHTRRRCRSRSGAAMAGLVPAWSWPSRPEDAPTVPAIPGLDDLTPAWAWGGSTGAGVRVAVIDSGIDNAHPAIAGCVKGYISFSEGGDGSVVSS